MLKRLTLVATSLLLLVGVGACSSLAATPTPEVISGRVPMDGVERGEHGIRAKAFDLIQVEVVVTQQEDQYRRCSKPSVVDPFGNILVALTPADSRPTGANYRYAMIAPVEGQYSVVLENTECTIALWRSYADVRWQVSHPSTQ